MPLTFPSHAAAVLPLKAWRPRRFDGVALVVGSAAPDVPYVLHGYGPDTGFGHTWLGTVLVSLPIALVGSYLIRWAAPAVAAHLPGFLADYGVLGRPVRYRWWVTVGCAYLGVLSHALWDLPTHDHLPGDVGARLPGVTTTVGGQPLHHWLHLGSTAVGAAVWLAYTVQIGRRGLLREWHGEPPGVTTRPVPFWSVAGIVSAGCAALTPLLAGFPNIAVVGVWLIMAAGLGPLAATAVLRCERAERLVRGRGDRRTVGEPPSGTVRCGHGCSGSQVPDSVSPGPPGEARTTASPCGRCTA